jgi:uncharacterized protein YebE (UPF0316 family)
MAEQYHTGGARTGAGDASVTLQAVDGAKCPRRPPQRRVALDLSLHDLGAAALIAALRTVDVCLGTIRTVYTVEGRRRLSALLGFLEAVTFITAVGIALRGPMDPLRTLGYGAGFAIGTALGITVVRALKLGSVSVRIVSPSGPVGLSEALEEAGFTLTIFDGSSRSGPIRLIMTVVSKRDLPKLLETAKPWLEQCFVTVGDEPLRLSPFPPPSGIRK